MKTDNVISRVIMAVSLLSAALFSLPVLFHAHSNRAHSAHTADAEFASVKNFLANESIVSWQTDIPDSGIDAARWYRHFFLAQYALAPIMLSPGCDSAPVLVWQSGASAFPPACRDPVDAVFSEGRIRVFRRSGAKQP